MKRYHLSVEPLEQEEIDHAIERYFADHPELNPERVSVLLRAVDDGTYEALGYTVVPLPAGAVTETAEQTADIPLEELAEVAFDAYAAQLSHANHTMDVAEGWRNQGAEVKDGFAAAAHAVQDRVLGRPLLDAPTLARPDEGH